MKSLFSPYYGLSESDFKTLWKKATFIFDANVLLNMYRYQSKTSNVLLNVLGSLQKRIWIPYHVALEFNRNRLSVIEEQHSRFKEVQLKISSAVSGLSADLDGLQLKTRHSSIDPDEFLSIVNKAKEDFFKKLVKLQDASISLSSKDYLRDSLEQLFFEKIGNPPESQEWINGLNEEGGDRYKRCIPPGYKDSSKDDGDPGYVHAGIFYQKKFGDLIIWKQILSHVKEKKIKDVVFVTDDNKTDWWQVVKGKTIGPRPELLDEIYRNSGVERFHLYTTESFLKFAKDQIQNSGVTTDALEEVSDVVSVEPVQKTKNMKLHLKQNSDFFRGLESFAESRKYYFFNWLRTVYEHVESNDEGFPNYTAFLGDKKYGYEFLTARYARLVKPILINKLVEKARWCVKEGGYYKANIVFCGSEDEIEVARLSILKALDLLEEKEEQGGKVHIVLGTCDIGGFSALEVYSVG